jgi:hypothetical protein
MSAFHSFREHLPTVALRSRTRYGCERRFSFGFLFQAAQFGDASGRSNYRGEATGQVRKFRSISNQVLVEFCGIVGLNRSIRPIP